jgi:rubrerythrin
MDGMDLSKFTMEAIFLAAIKSEVEANAMYSALAIRVRNAFLKERLEFLAREEERHRAALAQMFKTYFPSREPRLPDKSPVPLPDVRVDERNPPPLVEVLGKAMRAEKAAQSFYLGMARKLSDDRQVSDTLRYFAAMEANHYRILEAERANAQRFEDYDDYNPLMHAGP